MRLRTIAFWVLIAVMAAAPVSSFAIQTDASQVHPKQSQARPTGPTLLVLCDLACSWKLDGEAKGSIEAGASAKVRVEPGQHLVVASTEDGEDQLKQHIEVKAVGQTLDEIDLQPVRDARLKAEREAKDAAAQEAKDKSAQEGAARLQELRDHAAERFSQGRALYNQKSYEEAKPLLEAACDGGIMYGCALLGKLYQNGWGATQDYVQARTLYQKACDGGSGGGCYNLGFLYQNGMGVAQDYVQAATLQKMACDGGSLDGCYLLGVLYQFGRGVTQDYAQAATLFQKACGGGIVQACSDLAGLYQNGQGVALDNAQASALYQKACDGGLQPSCAMAAALGGQLEQHDPARQQQAAPAAAAANTQDLRDHAAERVIQGQALYNQQRFGEAMLLYQQACDGGDALGCRNLGYLYQYGQGVKQDYARALAAYQKSCDGMYTNGCISAAWLYETGRGVSHDIAQARKLYKKACDAGDREACADLRQLP